MKLIIACTLSGTLALTACNNQKLTEAELLGAWHSVDEYNGKTDIPRDIIFRREGSFLWMFSYYRSQFGGLNTEGDSIVMRQGCFIYKTPISLRTSMLGDDTLTFEGLKYVRMDTATYVKAYNNYAIEHRRLQLEWESKHRKRFKN